MLHKLVVTAPISEAKLQELKGVFDQVVFQPDGQVDDQTAKEADIWYTTWLGLPKSVTSLEEVPSTKVIQLSSAGANDCLAHPVFSSDEAKEKIKICSASVYMKLNLETSLTRSTQTWLASSEIGSRAKEAGWSYTGHRPLYGKTVGLLGYGHIARETARLFKAFNCRVIAATSNGSRRPATGYELEGLGDAEGDIPDQFFSTSDPAQLRDFASQCDILVTILPSTPQTRFLLKAEHFDAMPKDSVFVSVGRGDIAKSEDILAAVERKDGLLGAVLDVTDPEPLPAGHALFSHPRIIVTPHTSGSVENYFDHGVNILLEQQKAAKEGKEFINVVDVKKGY